MIEEEWAWIVDPQSSESIAAGLLAVLSDRQGARTRAARARFALAERSADEIADRYDEVYKEIVGRRHARRGP
jgi:glycosyltransferase involved in cell wall biosynthesis